MELKEGLKIVVAISLGIITFVVLSWLQTPTMPPTSPKTTVYYFNDSFFYPTKYSYVILINYDAVNYTVVLLPIDSSAIKYQIPSFSPFIIRVPEQYYLTIHPDPSRYLVWWETDGVPVGVASYPRSTIYADMVAGYFYIDDILVDHNDGADVPADGASLQLNAFIEVRKNGSIQHYWVQNVLALETEKRIFKVGSCIWNATPPGGLNVSGFGRVYVTNESSYYIYVTHTAEFKTPFAGFLIIRVQVINGNAVVSFGYAITYNGEYQTLRLVNWYDDVTIGPADDAKIVATMQYRAANGMTLNTELVFAGYAIYATATFRRLNASLALLYWDGGAVKPMPNIYSFGLNTGEKAKNITAYYKDGLVYVVAGKEDVGFLGEPTLSEELKIRFHSLLGIGVPNPYFPPPPS